MSQRRKKLVIFIGAQASGKSTYRKNRIPKSYVIVSPDGLRLSVFNTRYDAEIEPEVWKVVYAVIEAGLKKRKSVVVDATNIGKDRRDRYIALAKKYGVRAEAIIFDTPVSVALRRNAQRIKDKVPENVVRSTYRKFERFLTTARQQLKKEGFEKVTIIKFREKK